MPRRASSPGPGPSSLSRASSPSTAPNSEPISLGDADDTLSRAWHSWIHRSPPRSTTPSRFDVELERTRLKVTKALGSIIQVAGDQVLPIAAEALSVAPIPALAPAVKILDSIWKSVNAVQTNRTACLRLTDRCASLLLAIQDKVARSGDAVARELEAHLKTLEQSFSDIDDFFKEQVELPFIYRYIKRDEIHESITRHNQSVNDCIMLFSLGVNLSHMAASLQMQQSMHAHQLELVTPAQVSMLLAQDETNPPSPISEADPEAPHLTNFPPAGTPHTLHGDIPSPSGKTYEIQQIEDDSDSASDADDLRRVLRSALDAPDNRTVTRILQIPNADMSVPAMTKALLQELEREQQQPVPPAGSSPSPRTRTLTWPVDGIPARQVALLNRQFVEVALEALKRMNYDSSASSSLVIGTLGRAHTDIRIQPPSSSSNNSSRSAHWSWGTETAITTPLSTDNPLPPESSMPDDRPIDPFQAATEIRYRMSLSHAFHHLSVTLPLWTPTLVELGAVGYLAKPAGAFQTLFNCRDPGGTSNGRLSEIPRLPSVSTVIQKQNQGRGLHTRSVKLIDKFKLNQSTSVIKRTYAISALGETAHLIAEKDEYQYFEHHDVLKKWFRGNVQAIVDAYHPEFLREELFLVVGTLNVRDHALFVNHGSADPEESFETQFHVISSPRPGQAWGYFKPFPKEGTHEASQTICKVSNSGSGPNTVLLSRLRFRPDELEPTAH